MKRLLFVTIIGLCLSAGSVSAYESPGRPTGFVNDFAGIMTTEERAVLENTIGNFERPAGVEMSVVTVVTLGGDTIENFAEKLFQEWGIGKARKDNGVLFLIAPNEREARIEVGYGLEPVVTDAASSFVMRNIIVPRFAEGDYHAGISDGVDALIKLVEGDPEFAGQVEAYEAQGAEAGEPQASSIDWVQVAFVIIVLIILFSRRKRGGRGGGSGFLAGLLLGGMGRGRGGLGGFGGGGFGGFGGGRSGGGGVSGKW
jgi:uncharacterized protein